MSNLTIGRVGFDVRVDSVSQWESRGDTVTVTFQSAYGSVDDANLLRQNLLGYVGSSDERVVPVTWADHSVINGFYRVLGASVSPHPDGAFAGVYVFTVELQPVQGHTSPLLESTLTGATRVNTFSVSLTKTCVGVPAAARSFISVIDGTYVPFSPDFTVESDSGAVAVYRLISKQLKAQFYVPPERFYDGAVTLGMGESMLPVVGRQVRNTVADWRLANGLVSLTPQFDDGLFSLSLASFADGEWSAPVAVDFLGGVSNTSRVLLEAPHTITVLRNTPECVTVRLLCTTLGGYTPVVVDVSLRRGSRHFGVELRAGFSSYFGVRIPDLVTPTPMTQGFWKHVSGVDVFVAAPETVGMTGSQFYPNQTSVQFVDRWSFMFGAMVTGDDVIFNSVDEYMWAGAETVSVVAR